MQIQIKTDSRIAGNAEFAEQIKAAVRNSLDPFSAQVTRVEVHLSDQNSNKRFGTEDKRGLAEARLEGLQPVSVSDSAATLEQAVDGAVDRLTRSLDSNRGRTGDL